MNKSRFLDFIDKYHLGGNIDAVVLTSKNNKLSTNFITGDRLVMGNVSLNEFKFEDANLPIYETSKLLRMMKVLGNDVNHELNVVNDKSVALKLSDGGTHINYMLGELEIFPDVPKLTHVPSFELSVTIDDEFIDKFIKASDALPDVNEFTIASKKGGKSYEVIFGYALNKNSNKVTFDIVTNKGETLSPISFNAKYFRHILLVNRGMKDAIFNISSEGLAHISFKSDLYESNYYLVKVDA